MVDFESLFTAINNTEKQRKDAQSLHYTIWGKFLLVNLLR